MASNAYLLQLPDPNSMPSRTLRDGVSAMAINAESVADARAMAKAQYGNDVNAMWDAADATSVAADADMSGWKFRVRLVSPAGVVVFDETAEADGATDDFVAATGTLTLTPGAIADDKVQIDGVYYQFAADPTSDGSADGSSGHPWQVDVGSDDEGSLANLLAAINASGTAGTTYSTALTIHPTVTATASDATTLSAAAKVKGSAANSISTTVVVVSSDDGLAWGATTLEDGVGAVDLPSGLAMKMVALLNADAAIDGAAFDDATHTITVAETTDALGDHRIFAYFIPAEADEDELIGIPGFIADKTDDGDSGDALELVIAADTHTIPTLIAELGAAA